MFISKKSVIVIYIHYIQILAAGNDRDWWKYTTVYEIFIWSFKDSNGDGIGDLKGIISMLDHFIDLEIETIWLSPIYESPMVDYGYDVSDYYNIDPRFGTMEDFDELMMEMKKRKMKLIMDFVLNHSSNKHPWFLKSVDGIDPYSDYFIWKDPKGYDKDGAPIPPNNWRSIVGSAWQWNSKRKQFYYHYFHQNQVDFNLRHPNMLRESKNVIKFWFDKGVAGGRLDCAGAYMEDTLLRDEDYSLGAWPNPRFDLPDNYRKYTYNQWDSYQFIHELRTFIDSHYNSESNDEKILISETHTTWNHTMQYYGNSSYKIVHFPLNDIFTYPTHIDSPKALDNSIKNWLRRMPDHGIANWQGENHDKLRMSNNLHVNPEFPDILLIIMMMLPGVACIYYGQEIGMDNAYLRPDQIQDFMGRDVARSPMQWDDSTNAGFSSNGKTWLPVHPNYWRVNVKVQKKQPNSRYNLYKTLSKLRKTATLKHGIFTSYLVLPKNLKLKNRNP